MSEIQSGMKSEMQKNLDLMLTLRDEIRVRLHLAGMEAKDEWNKLEPKLIEIEKIAHDFTETTATAISDAVFRLKALRTSLN